MNSCKHICLWAAYFFEYERNGTRFLQIVKRTFDRIPDFLIDVRHVEIQKFVQRDYGNSDYKLVTIDITSSIMVSHFDQAKFYLSNYLLALRIRSDQVILIFGMDIVFCDDRRFSQILRSRKCFVGLSKGQVWIKSIITIRNRKVRCHQDMFLTCRQLTDDMSALFALFSLILDPSMMILITMWSTKITISSDIFVKMHQKRFNLTLDHELLWHFHVFFDDVRAELFMCKSAKRIELTVKSH